MTLQTLPDGRAGADRADRVDRAGVARRAYAEGLRDGDPRRRVAAVKELVALGAVSQVVRVIDDPDRDVRAAVAAGMAALGPPTVVGKPPGAVGSAGPADTADLVGTLDRLLADRDHVVRITAMDAAVELGMPALLAGHCARATTHRNWLVRKRAVVALQYADQRIAVRPLIAAVKDPVVDVRRAAIRSLRRWGRSGRGDVVAALTGALNDPDPGVRTEARWVLA